MTAGQAGVDLGEGVEDVAKLSLRDTDAGVPDDDVGGAGSGAAVCLEADAAALRGELDGVVEQAFQNLGNGGGVGGHGEVGR